MNRKTSRIAETVILAAAFAAICTCLVLMMTGVISMSAGLIAGILCAAIAWALIYLLHYRSSAYGGRFHHNYPDAS